MYAVMDLELNSKLSTSCDVVLVTYNACKHVVQCLASLEDVAAKYQLRIVVVDNASSDTTSQEIAQWSKRIERLQIITCAENLGYSGAVNKGLQVCESSEVFLLDDDLIFCEEAFTSMRAALVQYPEVGLVSPKVVFPGDQRIFCAEFCLSSLLTRGHQELDKGQRNYTRFVDAVPGPCWLVRKEVLDAVGGFDEQFFPSQFEDIDYSIRVRLLGYKILYLGTTSVVHDRQLRLVDYRVAGKNLALFQAKWQGVLDQYPWKDSSVFDDLVANAHRLQEAGDIQEAYELLLNAYTRNDGCYDYLQMGQLAMNLADLDQALYYFNQALALGPESPVLFDCLGRVHASLGNTEQAKKFYRKALDVLASE